MILLACGHEFHEITLRYGAVENLEVCYDSAEGVEHGVEYQRLQRGCGVALGGGNAFHYGAEHVGNAESGLTAGPQYLLPLASEQLDDLILHFVWFGGVEVHFIEHGNDLQIIFDGHVEVGYGLGLYALRCVHDEQGALAGCYRARHFIGKVDVSGGVDQVEHIFFTVKLIVHLYGMALDGDAALALQLHVVEDLRLQVL